MASFQFQNEKDVQNQVGRDQKIFGPVFNAPVHFGATADNWSESSPPNEILKSLSFPQMLDRRANVRQPHKNTCQWILNLEEYIAWKTQPCGLLWIKGKPGAGKSTVMSFLYDTLRQDRQVRSDIHLDFFFSARGIELQRTPLGMLRSLLNQLFQQDHDVRSDIRQIFQEKQAAFGQGSYSWVWQRSELERLLTQTVIKVAKRRSVMIFVDALDEAGESALDMSAYFHDLHDCVADISGAVQICISCRHFPIVASVPSTEIVVEDHNGSDIAAYVRDQFRLAFLRIPHSADHRPWQELESELLHQSQNVFQWAHLVVPLVRKYITYGESPEKVRQRLLEIPNELSDVYHHIIFHVIDVEDREMSICLFQWVCLAERPLSVAEMRYALAATKIELAPRVIRCRDTRGFVADDESMRLRVTVLSGGLAEVIVREKRYDDFIECDDVKEVQLIHQSVKDFFLHRGLAILMMLEDRPVSMLPKSLTRGDQEHAIIRCQRRLYRCCLYYTMAEVIMSEHPRGMQYRSETGVIMGGPFIRYTMSNIFQHAGEAGGRRFKDVNEEILLLRQMFPFWITVGGSIEHHSGSWSRKPGTTLLHVTSAAGLVDAVSYLTEEDNTIIDDRDHEGNSALHIASQCGRLSIVVILVGAGADIEAQNKARKTPLVLAAGQGYTSVVEWLLQHQKKNASSSDASSGCIDAALYAASIRGRWEVVHIMLTAGADVNARGGLLGSALHAALYRGHERVVRLLLQHAADTNVHGFYGSALQTTLAAQYNDEAIIQLLLEHGADVNENGGHYGTALQTASVNGHRDFVRYLLDQGADINVQGGFYGNALQAAVRSRSTRRYWNGDDTGTATIQLLLDRGADINAEGGLFGNALCAATYELDMEAIQLLLKRGANVNGESGDGGNALQLAVLQQRGHESKEEVDQKHSGGEKAPQIVAHPDMEVLQLLLEHGASIRTRDGMLMAILKKASLDGCEEGARLLLRLADEVMPELSGTNHLNLSGGERREEMERYCVKIQLLLDSFPEVSSQASLTEKEVEQLERLDYYERADSEADWETYDSSDDL